MAKEHETFALHIVCAIGWVSMVPMCKPSRSCQQSQGICQMPPVLLKLQRIVGSTGSGLPSSLVPCHISVSTQAKILPSAEAPTSDSFVTTLDLFHGAS